MAHIEPFRAARPRRDLARLVAAPPYDVLSSDEARDMAAGNPYSFLHVGKPEIDLPPGTDLYADAVYAKGKENFERFLRDRVLIRDAGECFYVYKQVWGEHTPGRPRRRRLLPGLSRQRHQEARADPPRQGKRPHAAHRDARRPDGSRVPHLPPARGHRRPRRRRHGRRAGVRFHDRRRRPQRLLRRRRARAASPPSGSAFAAVENLYVADGHHRSAAATRIKVERDRRNPRPTGREEYSFFLAVIFPHNQMKILPYNRVVRDLNGLGAGAFLARVEERFLRRPEERATPAKPHEFSLFLDGRWHLLEPRPGTFARRRPDRLARRLHPPERTSSPRSSASPTRGRTGASISSAASAARPSSSGGSAAASSASPFPSTRRPSTSSSPSPTAAWSCRPSRPGSSPSSRTAWPST